MMNEVLTDGVRTETTGTGTAQYEIMGDTMDLIIDYTADEIYDALAQPFPAGKDRNMIFFMN